MMKDQAKNVSCFIAASTGADTRLLRAVLTEKGIDWKDVADLPAVATSLSEAVKQTIAAADFVLAVLSTDLNPNVLYEVGVATGVGKPVFVVAPQKLELPADLSGTITWRINLRDKGAVSFALDQSLIAFRQAGRLPAFGPGPQTHPVPQLASQLLHQLSTAAKKISGSELTQAIAAVLTAGGARVVTEASLGSVEALRPDLAVWVNELESFGANPLLIHIYPKLSGAQTRVAARNMTRQLRSAHLRWGVVMYWEGEPSP